MTDTDRSGPPNPRPVVTRGRDRRSFTGDWALDSVDVESRLRLHDEQHRESMERLEQSEEHNRQVAKDMHTIRRIAEKFEEGIGERTILKHRVHLMWAGYLLVLGALAVTIATAVVLSGVKAMLEPSPTLSSRQEIRILVADIIPDIPAAERIQSGSRRGFPKVWSINQRLKVMAPGSPRADGADRDWACDQAPTDCVLP